MEVQVEGDDRAGIFMDISQMLYSLGYSFLNINAKRNEKNKTFAISFRIEVSAIADLEALMDKIRTIPSVTNVFRVNK